MFKLIKFFKQIHVHRAMIKAMAIREIRTRYIGTIGGMLWSIIHPFMTVAIYWFVFSVGLKVQPASGMPFIVVFLCGFIPWLMFQEALSTSATAINANSHLVKQTVFPTEILPVVYLVVSLVTHGIMLIIFAIVLLINNIQFSIYNFQFLYYLFALLVFTLGLSWFFAAVNVFFKDVAQTLTIILNMWFWFTPIIWGADMIPQKYQFIIKLNPMLYIVEGYRASFIYHEPISRNMHVGIYFWVICGMTLFAGAYIFRSLKQEFAEIL
jgi:ABC-type polysaccharide/polyol phosphate export permease